MIHIENQTLLQTTVDKLAEYQQEIDAITIYAERVTTGKKMWENRTDNKAFQNVRATLSAMCSGSRRCMYCEDSCADEVEHIKPKDLYPEVVFVWDNYLYACGSCNGGKNNAYTVFDAATGEIVDVTQKEPDVPPTIGDDVFINPRFENPFDYLWLDLSGTFAFQSIPNISKHDKERAKYTIEILKLNRDLLLQARKEAYGNYRARLTEYIFKRGSGVSEGNLKTLIEALIHINHPTVWREMKRQHQIIPELQTLFAQAPKALNW